MADHEATQSSLFSQLGAQAKKAYAGGVAGASAVIVTLSFSGFFTDGKVDPAKVWSAIGAVVIGFVGGFLPVFFAPKNHPDPTTQSTQPAMVPPSDVDYRTEQ